MAVRAFNDRFGPGFGGPLNVGTLVLKVGTAGPDPAYQDGDIICAFSRRRTRHVHANAICHPRRAQRNASGLIPLDHIARHYAEAIHQYKLERVSPTAVVRTNLWTQEVDVLGATPNERGEVMHVDAYVRRHRGLPGFAMFGAEGAEVWFGGARRADMAHMDTVWAAIEQHTPLREADFGLYPLSTEELKVHLALHVDNFDDAEADALTATVLDATDPVRPVIVRKRQRQLPWRELRDMSAQRIAQIEDRARPVDIRAERKHVRAVHVRARNG